MQENDGGAVRLGGFNNEQLERGLLSGWGRHSVKYLCPAIPREMLL